MIAIEIDLFIKLSTTTTRACKNEVSPHSKLLFELLITGNNLIVKIW